jgi:hypothetical protein
MKIIREFNIKIGGKTLFIVGTSKLIQLVELPSRLIALLGRHRLSHCLVVGSHLAAALLPKLLYPIPITIPSRVFEWYNFASESSNYCESVLFLSILLVMDTYLLPLKWYSGIVIVLSIPHFDALIIGGSR